MIEPMNLSELVTERARADLADLDLRSTEEIVELMVDEERQVQQALERAAPRISRLVDAAVDQLEAGGRIVYVGAGTAGRLGLLDAAECGPTFNTDRVIALLAGGSDALDEAHEGAEDDEDAGRTAVERVHVSDRDLVVGIAASGRTPYTLAAVEAAAAAGAVTAAIVSNPDTPLASIVDHPIEVVTGPEVIAGSTRLKAGTAQKTVLNILSTVAMVRFGKTFGNLMVDVRTTNQKLHDRARRIVAAATGADLAAATRALREADGDVKVAIVSLVGGVDTGRARELLASADGRVRPAIDGDSR